MDALVDHPEMEGIQAKHESHAVHMADVYYTGHTTQGRARDRDQGPRAAQLRGRPWPRRCTNMSAVIVITGLDPPTSSAREEMQELYYHGFEDAISVMRPVTKGRVAAGAARHCDRSPQSGLQTSPLSGADRARYSCRLPIDVQQVHVVEGEIEAPHRRARSPTRSRA